MIQVIGMLTTDHKVASICLSVCLCALHLPYLYSLTTFTRDDLFKKYKNYARYSAINKTSFTQDEKNLILQLSNAYRSVVYPYAFEMRELTWDDDLEEYTRNHTQLCTGAHSSGTMVKKNNPNDPTTWEKWYNMGEVLYYMYGGVYSVEEAFYLFWEEGSKYDIATDNCTHSNTCGHYKVMTTDHSSKIGCSLNVCYNFSVSKYPTPATLFMCSYDGMYLDKVQPYSVGQACTGCTKDRLGYWFQYCRNRLCIGPPLKFNFLGFNGSTAVIGFEFNDIIIVDDSSTSVATTPTSTAVRTTTVQTTLTTLVTTTQALTSTSAVTQLTTTTEVVTTKTSTSTPSTTTTTPSSTTPSTTTTTPSATTPSTTTTTPSTTTPSATTTTPSTITPSTITTTPSTITTTPSTTTPSTITTTPSTNTTTPSTITTTPSTTTTTPSTTTTTPSTTTPSTTTTIPSTTTTTPSTTTPSTTTTTPSTTTTIPSTTTTTPSVSTTTPSTTKSTPSTSPSITTAGITATTTPSTTPFTTPSTTKRAVVTGTRTISVSTPRNSLNLWCHVLMVLLAVII